MIRINIVKILLGGRMTDKKKHHCQERSNIPSPNDFFNQVFDGLIENKERQDELIKQIRQHEREHDKPSLRKLDL